MPRSPKPPGTRMPSSPATWPASPPRPARSAAAHTPPPRAGQPLALDALGVDPHHVHRGLVGDAPVGQRLVETLVGVLHLDVLAHHPDAAAPARCLHPTHDLLPAGEIDRPR